MGIEISKSHAIMANALDYRAARQDLIAGNIANEDTPFYHPRDLDFADVLKKQAREAFSTSNSSELKLAKTDDSHFSDTEETSSRKPSLYFRDGHLARNDGNSVDLDVETTEMTKNALAFQAITAALKKNALLFKSVIDASKRTQ